MGKAAKLINQFQPSVIFHTETCNLICWVNQMTGFYMKCNPEMTGLTQSKSQLLDFKNYFMLSRMGTGVIWHYFEIPIIIALYYDHLFKNIPETTYVSYFMVTIPF